MVNLAEQEIGLLESWVIEYGFARALLRLGESSRHIQHPRQSEVAARIGRIDVETLSDLRLGVVPALHSQLRRAQHVVGLVERRKRFDGSLELGDAASPVLDLQALNSS